MVGQGRNLGSKAKIINYKLTKVLPLYVISSTIRLINHVTFVVAFFYYKITLLIWKELILVIETHNSFYPCRIRKYVKYTNWVHFVESDLRVVRGRRFLFLRGISTDTSLFYSGSRHFFIIYYI